MKLFTASLATLFALIPLSHAVPTHQFDHFFPGWNERVQVILRDNCSEPYDAYLTGNIDESQGKQSLVNPVIDCILEVFPESRKAECKCVSQHAKRKHGRYHGFRPASQYFLPFSLSRFTYLLFFLSGVLRSIS